MVLLQLNSILATYFVWVKMKVNMLLHIRKFIHISQLQKKHNVIALTVYLRFKYTLIKTLKVISVAVKVVIYVKNS